MWHYTSLRLATAVGSISAPPRALIRALSDRLFLGIDGLLKPLTEPRSEVFRFFQGKQFSNSFPISVGSGPVVVAPSAGSPGAGQDTRTSKQARQKALDQSPRKGLDGAG